MFSASVVIKSQLLNQFHILNRRHILALTCISTHNNNNSSKLIQRRNLTHQGNSLIAHRNRLCLDTTHLLVGSVASREMASAASTSGNKTNRLVFERSPYLLQHANNPVDWYPWSEEAFDKAKKENKVIFLSVGYSTCHWCHVMERESFESEEVAKILNQHFVSIKVDREERPDVDRIYMSYVQKTSGGGGWPMSVFLTPNLEPLYGGTYFPPEDKYGRLGFMSLLQMIAKQWNEKHSTLYIEARKGVLEMQRLANIKFTNSSSVPGEEAWRKCMKQLCQFYEEVSGGFSEAPKFPQPTIFNFLFHLYGKNRKTEEGKIALDMCLHTLKKMAYGGIHDHVNCGFARYSVDGKWHVPHFEKMLYDQAQLVVSYIDAYVCTKDKFYEEIVDDILKYVNRDLGHVEGGFYGAEDADSYPTEQAEKKQEGAFCVWEYDEIRELLKDDKEFEVYCYHFAVKEGGNVEARYDPHGELIHKNVLCCFGTYEETAEHFEMCVDDLKKLLAKCNEILYVERSSRPKPQTDTKIVTSWNGLMMGAFAKAGFALKKSDYTERAVLSAKFIKKNLYMENGSLLRCCYLGDDGNVSQTDAPIQGFLDDYAFLIRGLLDLYEATLDSSWLQWAEALQEKQDLLFWDPKNYGYFTTSPNDSTIIVRDKEDQDGAEPCGNSVSVHNLIRLAAYMDRQDLRQKAEKTLSSFSERLLKIPLALPEMTSALMLYHSTPTQVFIAGETDANETQALLDVVRTRFIPGRILAMADGPQGRGGLLYARHESLAKLHPIQGKPAAYVCRNFACSLPVTNPEDLATSLDSECKKPGE